MGALTPPLLSGRVSLITSGIKIVTLISSLNSGFPQLCFLVKIYPSLNISFSSLFSYSNQLFSFAKYLPSFLLCSPPPFLFLPPLALPQNRKSKFLSQNYQPHVVLFVPWSMPICFREVHLEHQKPRAGSWGGR